MTASLTVQTNKPIQFQCVCRACGTHLIGEPHVIIDGVDDNGVPTYEVDLSECRCRCPIIWQTGDDWHIALIIKEAK